MFYHILRYLPQINFLENFDNLNVPLFYLSNWIQLIIKFLNNAAIHFSMIIFLTDPRQTYYGTVDLNGFGVYLLFTSVKYFY